MDNLNGIQDSEQPRKFKRIMRKNRGTQLVEEGIICEDWIGEEDFFNKHGNF